MTAVLSPSILVRARTLVAPRLRSAVERLDPATRAVAAYHLGWTEADGTPREDGGGKAVRPALALLSAELAGAPPEVGLPGAVAVELVHNFSLLHDDVMDGDAERRHRPTVWSLWGVACAILAGDALADLAVEVVLESDSAHACAAGRLLTTATRDLIRGQVEDLAFERRPVIGLDECFAMADGKTGALLGASCTIGAVLAGAPAPLVRALDRYGRHLGAAFQLVDDLLGIWGDPAVTGKPVCSDLRSRKKSLPVTYALARGGEAGRALADWYRTAPGSADDQESLARAADLVEAAGGRAWAADAADAELQAAESALDEPLRHGLSLPEKARTDLLDLGRYLARRTS